MLLPAEMEDFVRICICCKVVFDRGVSLSALGSYCGVGDFSHKVKYSPIFSLKPSQDRTLLCFSERPRMIYLEARAVGSDSVCDVTWVKWRWDQAKTPPGAAGQRVEDVAHPSLTAGKILPFTPCPLMLFMKLSCFWDSSERFDKICQGKYYFEVFVFLFCSFSVVQKMDFHTYLAQAPPDWSWPTRKLNLISL